MPSKIAIVGAGPGDPELLTVKAHRLITQADVVVYDRLVSEGVMALIPEAAKQIYAGKQKSLHHLPQMDINQLLVELAHSHEHVVRLKGGDPFIFGRGSEEAEHLRAHGVDFEIIPGITAAAGCSAYAGIPLTHRGLATSVRFVTGHAKPNGKGEVQAPDLNWKSLADPDTTLVIYMGLTYLPHISRCLMTEGLPASTPAAIVQQGTLPQQRTVITTLEQLPEDAIAHGMVSPATIIIGKVVEYSELLRWSWAI